MNGPIANTAAAAKVTKRSVYTATSVDGFIAGPGGDLEWLHRPEDASAEETDFGYGAFAPVDALVMGRNTFEKARSFPDWPYEDVPVVVLTGRRLKIPGRPPLRRRH